MAFNDSVTDGLTRHNISLMRYDAKLRRQVLGQLRRLQNNIVETLGNYDFTNVVRRARLEGLLKQVDVMIKGNYTNINRFMSGEMGDLAVAEHAFAAQQLNSLIGVDIVSAGIAPATLRALGKNAPIFGAPAAEHWGRQSANMRRRFADEMRQGYLLGESTGDLVRRVRGTATGARQIVEIGGRSRSVPVFSGGIMNVSTREAEALVRTSVQSVANDVRLATYMQNTDVIQSVITVVTLDTRTSDICQARGNRPDEWTLPDFEPVGSSSNYPGPPPWHFNCRSSLAPNTKSWEELQGQEATRNQRSIARKLDNNAPKATRASMNGQVAKGLGYGDWLKKQPKSVQVEVMGPTRQAAWKKGDLDLSKTLDQTGRPMTLTELGLKDSAAIGRPLPSISSRRVGFEGPDEFVAPPRATTVTNAGLTDLTVGQEFTYLDTVYKVHKVTAKGVEALPWSTRTGKFVTVRNRKTLAFKSKIPIKPKPPVAPPPTPPTPTPPTTGGNKIFNPRKGGVKMMDSTTVKDWAQFKAGDVVQYNGRIYKIGSKTADRVKLQPWSLAKGEFSGRLQIVQKPLKLKLDVGPQGKFEFDFRNVRHIDEVDIEKLPSDFLFRMNSTTYYSTESLGSKGGRVIWEYDRQAGTWFKQNLFTATVDGKLKPFVTYQKIFADELVDLKRLGQDTTFLFKDGKIYHITDTFNPKTGKIGVNVWDDVGDKWIKNQTLTVAKPTTLPTPTPPPTGVGTTTYTGKAPLVDVANYRTLKIDDVFKDTTGQVYKVTGKTSRGVKTVLWSDKSNRFLSQRNGKTLGYTSAPAKTVKQFSQSSANATASLNKVFKETGKVGKKSLKLDKGQRHTLKLSTEEMGKNGFNKVLADMLAKKGQTVQMFNMGRGGALVDAYGGAYRSSNVYGAYWNGLRAIGMRAGETGKRMMHTWIHEFGHHLDYTLFRTRWRTIPSTGMSGASEALLKELDDAYKGMLGEYRAASKAVGKDRGMRLKKGVMSEGQQKKDWTGVGRSAKNLRVAQSSYSLHNSFEWIAEAHSHYFGLYGSRDLMMQWQPETYRFFQTLFSKEMEPLWKEIMR